MKCDIDDDTPCEKEALFRVVYADGLFLDVCQKHYPTDEEMEGIDMIYESENLCTQALR